MKIVKYLTASAVILVLVLICFKRHKKEEALPETETPEQIFVKEWAAVLNEHSEKFAGLFGGLLRVESGNAKKPEKVLREWCQRTSNCFESQKVHHLCQEHILPLIEESKKEELNKWASLLLAAAYNAGIRKEELARIVLSETTANHYVEWDSCELYEGDQVEIISPAWYKEDRFIEQGQCRICE